jgi:hypothetical protein
MHRRTLLAAVGTLGVGSAAATLSAATLSETVAPTAQFHINVGVNLAVGKVNLSGNYSVNTNNVLTEQFHATFDDPVIIAKPLEKPRSRGHPNERRAHPRITSVGRDRFVIGQEEFNPKPGETFHTDLPAADVSYIVAEKGTTTTLDDGTRLYADKITLNEPDGFEKVDFGTPLNSPIAMAQIQAAQGGNPVVSHISRNAGTSTQSIGSSEMHIKIENDSNTGAHTTNEDVGYIAIESTENDVDTMGGVTFTAGDTDQDIRHEPNDRVEFIESSSNGFKADGFVADLQTYLGTQEHYLRYRALDEDGVHIFIEEDTGLDNNHAPNRVGYLAWDV